MLLAADSVFDVLNGLRFALQVISAVAGMASLLLAPWALPELLIKAKPVRVLPLWGICVIIGAVSFIVTLILGGALWQLYSRY